MPKPVSEIWTRITCSFSFSSLERTGFAGRAGVGETTD